MTIVIDIDEDYYEIIKHDVDRGMDYRPCVLIANGTPLPKNHGRLIDADYMIKQLLSLPKDELSTEDMWAMKVLDLAPTIIEADECTYKETGCGSCKRQLDCPIEADKENADEKN